MVSLQKLTIISFLLTANGSIKAQDNSQGEGIITVVIYNSSIANTIQSNNVIKSYRYFIKGNKVFRNDRITTQEKAHQPTKDTSIFQNKKNIMF